jgi:hypothetical protein
MLKRRVKAKRVRVRGPELSEKQFERLVALVEKGLNQRQHDEILDAVRRAATQIVMLMTGEELRTHIRNEIISRIEVEVRVKERAKG